MRVADYIARTLADRGLRHVFLVTGGGAMHLNDAFGREKRLEWVAFHHEQACAMAADSYFRLTGRLAAVNVTTGPGGLNALNGVFGAFTDSLGMIVVSGQVKRETMVASTGLPLRQLGDQEVDIVRIVAPITKYAVCVTDPATVRHHLEKALHLATEGRPGPVWLDVPIDVQAAPVNPETLEGWDPRAADVVPPPDRAAVREVLRRVAAARRPVVLAGGGVRVAGAYDLFLRAVERLGVPVTTAWNAHDLIWDDHPLYAGRPGSVGDRAGNFAVQNADLLLVLGSRLNIRQISYNWKSFARHAVKVVVDVDAAELAKPTLSIDLPIHAHLAEFLRGLLAEPWDGPSPEHRSWLAWCRARRARYPVVLPEYRRTEGRVNPYVFVDALTRALPDGVPIVTGDGTACVVGFQAAVIRPGGRLYTNSGCASMGYDLPAAIGASLASGRGPVVCLAGDGSLQMNVQELATVAEYRLPLKIFVLDNQGYHSIRQTQEAYFPDNVIAVGPGTGLAFPRWGLLAEAYGIPSSRIGSAAELASGLAAVLVDPGPRLCEVALDTAQPFAPKLASRQLPNGRMVSSPLEDMAPFLSREELQENMIVPPEET